MDDKSKYIVTLLQDDESYDQEFDHHADEKSHVINFKHSIGHLSKFEYLTSDFDESNEIVSDLGIEHDVEYISQTNSDDCMTNFLNTYPLAPNQINTNFIQSKQETEYYSHINMQYLNIKSPISERVASPVDYEDELLDIFSKRLMKAAIKMEIKIAMKKIAKHIYKDLLKLQIGVNEKYGDGIVLEMDRKFFEEPVETKVNRMYDYGNVSEQELIVIEPELEGIDVKQSINDCTSNCAELHSQCRYTPTYRAIATSPINIFDEKPDYNKKLFSSLNCMRPQHKSKIKDKSPIISKPKSAHSLFNRIFKRDKSKSKASTPAFYTKTYSKQSSNLSLDKFTLNYSCQTSPIKFLSGMDTKLSSAQTEHNFMKHNSQIDNWTHTFTNNRYMDSTNSNPPNRNSVLQMDNNFNTLDKDTDNNTNSVYIID